jgi:hypothetical protein
VKEELILAAFAQEHLDLQGVGIAAVAAAEKK